MQIDLHANFACKKNHDRTPRPGGVPYERPNFPKKFPPNFPLKSPIDKLITLCYNEPMNLLNQLFTANEGLRIFLQIYDQDAMCQALAERGLHDVDRIKAIVEDLGDVLLTIDKIVDGKAAEGGPSL
jgi:hypothetical protein